MVNSLPISLLGTSASSDATSAYLKEVSSLLPPGSTTPEPEVKCFPDAVYMNYFSLGLSLLYVPTNGYKPSTSTKASDLDKKRLVLDGIDFYNVPQSNGTKKIKSFSTHPVTPLVMQLNFETTNEDGEPIKRSSPFFEIQPTSTGSDFVRCLGEPNRKGGGAGPSSGSINIWCEWSADGIMVEFGGDEARGPQAWERGRDAVWKVISLLAPK